MEQCTLYDCEWDSHHPGVIIDNKVYVLDKANKPTDISSLLWDAWDDLLPLMQFYIGDYDETLPPEVKSSKWGFCNLLTGEIVVPPIYDYVYPFYGANLAQVILNQKRGFIDPRGKVIGQIVWDKAHQFVLAPLCAVLRGELWGYIRQNGELAFKPQFEEVGKWVKLFGIAPCPNPSKGEVLRQVLSEQGYATWVKKDGKYGYIDDQGKYLVEPVYDDARVFWAGYYAPVKVYGKWGFIEKTGQFSIPPIFSDVGECVYDLYVVKQEGVWCILSTDLGIVMPEAGERYVVYKGDKIYLKGGRVTSRRKIKGTS